MLTVVCYLLQIYILLVVAAIVLSWFRVPGDHPVANVQRTLRKVVDPVLLPIRRVIPPLRTGSFAIDLSAIILIIGLQILWRIICV